MAFLLCTHGQKERVIMYLPSSYGSAAAAKSLQSCPTLCDPIDSSPPGSHPWDSPGKNTGVGCHFLLQCMKVKRESEVAQSYPTLSDPMDCSLPGSSVLSNQGPILMTLFNISYLLKISLSKYRHTEGMASTYEF